MRCQGIVILHSTILQIFVHFADSRSLLLDKMCVIVLSSVKIEIKRWQPDKSENIPLGLWFAANGAGLSYRQTMPIFFAFGHAEEAGSHHSAVV
jgi:hypothetical protein